MEASITVTTGDIGKAQYVPRMNKICRQGWATILGNFDEYSSTQDPKLSKQERLTEAIQLSVLAGLDFHIFDNFRILGAPKGEEKEIEEMIGPFQLAVETAQKKVLLHSVADIVEHFSEYNRLASQYGLNDCLVDKSHLAPIEA